MLYVLTMGWQWFAGALAIGLAAGFLLAPPAAKAGEESGGWAASAAALALLAALGAASALQAVPGREGLMLDIAFLAGLAYFAGTPVGAWGKMIAARGETAKPPIAAAPEQPAKEAAPALVPAPEEIADEAPPETSVFPAPAPPEPEDLIPASEESPPEPPVVVAVEESASAAAPAEAAPSGEAAAGAGSVPAKDERPPQRKTKALPGVRPDGLEAPRGGTPDDLTKIKGLGGKSVEKLHALGIFHIDQVAAWNLENARWISAAIGGPGRVERGKWIQQAREIAAAAKARNNR
jgi:predicted flap endonuclease-1-like 5' DNA nuclease